MEGPDKFMEEKSIRVCCIHVKNTPLGKSPGLKMLGSRMLDEAKQSSAQKGLWICGPGGDAGGPPSVAWRGTGIFLDFGRWDVDLFVSK